MKRRTFLSIAAAAALTGCITPTERETGTPTPSGEGAAEPTQTETPIETSTPTETPTPATSQFDSMTCPDATGLLEDVGEVHCYHVEGTESGVYVEPSKTTLTLPRDEAEFTIHNDSGVRFVTNYYDWNILRQTSTGWEMAIDLPAPEPIFQLSDGQTHTWTLQLGGALPEQKDDQVAAVGNLKPGTYAFVVKGVLNERRADVYPAYAALFEVVQG